MILPLFRCERGEAVGSAIARRGVAATREIGLLPWFCMQFPVYSCARRARARIWDSLRRPRWCWLQGLDGGRRVSNARGRLLGPGRGRGRTTAA